MPASSSQLSAISPVSESNIAECGTDGGSRREESAEGCRIAGDWEEGEHESDGDEAGGRKIEVEMTMSVIPEGDERQGGERETAGLPDKGEAEGARPTSAGSSVKANLSRRR